MFGINSLNQISQLASTASASSFYLVFPHSLIDVFQAFGLKDIFDILIASVFIYFVLVFIRQTRSYFILLTFIVFFGIIGSSRIFDLTLTRTLLNPLLTFFIVIFVIVFQREIRRFFKWFALSRGSLSHRAINLTEEVTDAIVRSVMEMAKRRLGSIIVLSGEYPLDDIVEGGFPLDGKVSEPLLLSIFEDSTPGHDGAVLIENSRIKTFGLVLPLAEDYRDFSRFGTRHRAAIGITERTDCLALVVSEERGTVSIARGGGISSVTDAESLTQTIRLFMSENVHQQKSGWDFFVLNHFSLKVVSIVVALGLWTMVSAQNVTITKDIDVPIEFSSLSPVLQINKTSIVEATVTLSGNQTDINSLNPSHDLHLLVDLNDRGTGSYNLPLTKDNLRAPSYVNVIKVSPEHINLTISAIPTVGTSSAATK
ncbi:MAG: diadenylate cyclase [Candidatus Pacebacteria bacterium]|nr:diadenylate cyclase [Candidatus Paceibacterota bacterium]